MKTGNEIRRSRNYKKLFRLRIDFIKKGLFSITRRNANKIDVRVFYLLAFPYFPRAAPSLLPVFIHRVE